MKESTKVSDGLLATAIPTPDITNIASKAHIKMNVSMDSQLNYGSQPTNNPKRSSSAFSTAELESRKIIDGGKSHLSIPAFKLDIKPHGSL